MLPNRVLKKDTIIPMLKEYGDRIDIAVNNIEHRKRFKEVLVAFDHFDELYIETDLKSRHITWSHGVNKWLGHPDPEIDKTPLNFMADYVHPLIRDWYEAYVNAATLTFTKKQCNYLKSRFTITMPVRKANDEYVLIKQMSMPFGFDENNNLVSFIHSFSIFGTYSREPVKLEIFEGHEKMEDGTYHDIEDLIHSCISLRSENNLSKTLFSIIDNINQLKQKGEVVNTRNLSKHFKGLKRAKVADESTAKYLNRIRKHLMWVLRLDHLPQEDKKNYQKKYLPNYENALELIDYFEQSGILNLLRKQARWK
jgi:hypothetical protein